MKFPLYLFESGGFLLLLAHLYPLLSIRFYFGNHVPDNDRQFTGGSGDSRNAPFFEGDSLSLTLAF